MNLLFIISLCGYFVNSVVFESYTIFMPMHTPIAFNITVNLLIFYGRWQRCLRVIVGRYNWSIREVDICCFNVVKDTTSMNIKLVRRDVTQTYHVFYGYHFRFAGRVLVFVSCLLCHVVSLCSVSLSIATLQVPNTFRQIMNISLDIFFSKNNRLTC